MNALFLDTALTFESPIHLLIQNPPIILFKNAQYTDFSQYLHFLNYHWRFDFSYIGSRYQAYFSNSTSNLLFLTQTFTMPDYENIPCTLNHFNDRFYCIDLYQSSYH